MPLRGSWGKSRFFLQCFIQEKKDRAILRHGCALRNLVHKRSASKRFFSKFPLLNCSLLPYNMSTFIYTCIYICVFITLYIYTHNTLFSLWPLLHEIAKILPAIQGNTLPANSVKFCGCWSRIWPQSSLMRETHFSLHNWLSRCLHSQKAGASGAGCDDRWIRSTSSCFVSTKRFLQR